MPSLGHEVTLLLQGTCMEEKVCESESRSLGILGYGSCVTSVGMDVSEEAKGSKRRKDRKCEFGVPLRLQLEVEMAYAVSWFIARLGEVGYVRDSDLVLNQIVGQSAEVRSTIRSWSVTVRCGLVSDALCNGIGHLRKGFTCQGKGSCSNLPGQY